MKRYRHTYTLTEPVVIESTFPAEDVSSDDLLRALDEMGRELDARDSVGVHRAFKLETSEEIGVEVPRPRATIALRFERLVKFGALQQTRRCFPNQVDAIVHNMTLEGFDLIDQEPL